VVMQIHANSRARTQVIGLPKARVCRTSSRGTENLQVL